MFDQVAGNERKNSMVLSQTQEFAPVERREIPIRNALDPLRSQLRASQRAQELKHEPLLYLDFKKSTDSIPIPPVRRQCEPSVPEDAVLSKFSSSWTWSASLQRKTASASSCAQGVRGFKILCSDATQSTPPPSALHLDGPAGRPRLVPDRFGTKQRLCPRRYP